MTLAFKTPDIAPTNAIRLRSPRVRRRWPIDRLAGSHGERNSRRSLANVELIPDLDYGKCVNDTATLIWVVT